MTRIAIARAVALSLLSFSASAADISASDTIVVTATRTEIPLDDAIVPVRVITREDIELSLATDLAELLRFEAGLDIGRNGGPGQASSLFIRGTESNHTLVLIDGVRINPGTLGGAPLQHVAPETIERIEIVKGARSALFGTDAIGGVINIITRRSDDAYAEAQLGAGSFATRSANFSAGTHSERAEYGIAVSAQDTDGYAPRTDSGIERGYDNLSLNAYGEWQLGTGSLSLRHWRAEGTVEYLDFFLTPVDQDFANQVSALQYDTTLAPELTSKLIVAHMADDIRQNQAADFVESSRVSLDWQLTKSFADHALTGGVYVVNEDASSLSFGSAFDEITKVRAVFLQDQYSGERQRAFVALRVSDYDNFGTQTTWNAEYGFDIADGWTLSGGLGRAFRAPDATDRYGFGGNPNLDPELADHANLRLRYRPGNRHSVDVELYANDIDDLIEFDFSTFTLQNVDSAEIRGAQLGYEYRGDTFTLRAELVRQIAENAASGARLLRRAERSASVSLTREIGAHRLGFSVLAAGEREDFGGVTLGSYVVANLTGQLALARSWRLNARVENLFDEAYETAANFRMQERSAFVELQYRWQ